LHQIAETTRNVPLREETSWTTIKEDGRTVGIEFHHSNGGGEEKLRTHQKGDYTSRKILGKTNSITKNDARTLIKKKARGRGEGNCDQRIWSRITDDTKTRGGLGGEEVGLASQTGPPRMIVVCKAVKPRCPQSDFSRNHIQTKTGLDSKNQVERGIHRGAKGRNGASR